MISSRGPHPDPGVRHSSGVPHSTGQAGVSQSGRGRCWHPDQISLHLIDPQFDEPS